MGEIQVKSLWATSGVKAIGKALVSVYPATIPGTKVIAPAIHINTCPDDLAEDVEAFDAFGSHVWALTTEGAVFAERIARDLARFGFAWVFPCEANHIRIQIGAMHKVHLIGFEGTHHG